jgi:SAM-dependent methyltransferase
VPTLGPPLPVGELVQRLADRSPSRTEANVQSDVRTLLLYGGLDLDEPQVVDLEVQTGDGTRRRIDIESGLAVFEVKKDLRVGNVRQDALEQLAGYVKVQSERLGQRYVGLLTDGVEWSLCHLRADDTLAAVAEFVVDASVPDAEALRSWLAAVLATQSAVAPTPGEIERRLGASSPGFQLDEAELAELYGACRDSPEVRLKRELWAKLLTTAYGVNFENDDRLFVEHTYLVLVAEVIAHAVVDIDPATVDPADLVSGRRFADRQVYGVVEADFFDWVLSAPGGAEFVRGLARRIARFDWSGVEHDVLKLLYESVIDAEQRHALGEYYTPDWLAEAAVSQIVDAPLEQRVLDPSCGSGTFLFHAVRAYMAAATAAGAPNAEAVAGVVKQVAGVDIHPVAVTLARVTYLLGIGLDRLRDRGSLTVPVYVGDSLQWGHEETLLTDGSISISTSDGLELVPRELKFPAAAVADASRFDQLVTELADRAADRRSEGPVPPIKGVLNRHGVHDPADRDVITQTFRVMCDLHDHRRDHIWGYYLRNLARPVWLSRPENRRDVIVGNPPWLSYRYMTPVMRGDFRAGSEERGLWAGAHVATSQDLSAYFVARAVQLYLRPGGRFAFVMPNAVLSRPHFAGFRRGQWTAPAEETAVSFQTPWDLSGVRPHLFPMPCALVFGERSKAPNGMGDVAFAYSGETPSRDTPWREVEARLTRSEQHLARPAGSSSPYGGVFHQGATVVPRALLTVEPQGATDALGGEVGYRQVRSLRSTQEKAPWRNVASLEGSVEDDFVRPLHLGATIAPFRCLAPLAAVIPWVDGHLLDGSSAELDEHPGLARWWREAETIWARHRSSEMSLRDRLDYHGLLTIQFPIPEHRVVYNRSGTRLVAAYVDVPSAVIDTKLYWGPVGSRAEADYICAVLNAPVMTELVNPLQGRGQFGPRDFYKLPFEFPIPTFDAASELHQAIASVGAEGSGAASALPPAAVATYRRARTAIWASLESSGLLASANSLVTELLLA